MSEYHNQEVPAGLYVPAKNILGVSFLRKFKPRVFTSRRWVFGMLEALNDHYRSFGIVRPGCLDRHRSFGIVRPGCLDRYRSFGIVRPGCLDRYRSFGIVRPGCL